MSSSSHSPGQSAAYGMGDRGASSQGNENGPLGSMNINFIRSLTERKTTKEGQAPKRRGPKPDSKPALTRRQELNRQAQRTHRERKEFYIKALEDEVLRLKEAYTNLSHEKDRLAEENKQLRGRVGANHGGRPSMGNARLGIGVGGGGGGLDDSISNPSLGYSGSVAGSNSNNSNSLGQTVSTHTTAYTPPPLSGGTFSGSPHHGHHLGGHSPMPSRDQSAGASQRNPGIDYDQAGIDFVLNLEKPCMGHLPWLLERRDDAGRREACGHALMASCPPDPFQELTQDVPFGTFNTMKQLPRLPGDNQPPPPPAAVPPSDMRTWELSKADLATLLQLSKRLDLDGEITPVMAWGMVLAHPRLGEMAPADFARITEELTSKIRCFGFGAVLEEFEVRDALESIFSTKADYYVPNARSNDIAMAY